jgi:hypothetical protein
LDLTSTKCLALLQFDDPLVDKVQVSFSINGTRVFLKEGGGTKSWCWCISPTHNINQISDCIENGDGTKSCVFSNNSQVSSKSLFPMIFVPMRGQLNQEASGQSQFCRWDWDGEWILNEYGRQVLWIPPDERPRSWSDSCGRSGRKVVIETESGKGYIVDVPSS